MLKSTDRHTLKSTDRKPAGIRPGSGRNPAGNRPELKAFIEAPSGMFFFFLEKTRSWNVEHAKNLKSVKMNENSSK